MKTGNHLFAYLVASKGPLAHVDNEILADNGAVVVLGPHALDHRTELLVGLEVTHCAKVGDGYKGGNEEREGY